MTWVYFEDSDRQVSAPAFSLERLGGGRVSLRDFYEQSMLVLLFPSGNTGGRGALARFIERQEEFERQGAQFVALIPDAGQVTADPHDVSDSGISILTDRGGQVRAKYAGLMVADLVPEGSSLLYVLDVYGAPWAAYVGETFDEDSLVDEVLSWLTFIGVQCPE